MRAARDIGKGLVDRDALDQRREIAEHLDRGIAQPLVLLEMAADENEVRAELARPPSRHAAATPNAFASYEAASTTPPPTAIGLPRSDGSSSCSTEA